MSERPNIIVILSDDQGPWALGCKTPELKTPSLDKMAQEGMRFENFYCASPVCSPARASLLTGMIPSAHGVLDWLRGGNMRGDNADKNNTDLSDYNEPIEYLKGIRGYTDYLCENGYVCGHSGKWHLGDSMTPQKSFSFWYTHQYGGGNYYGAPMIENGVPYTEERYVTDVITDRALDFLTAQSGKKPFYLSVNYTAPHSPWEGCHPKELLDYYDACGFPSIPRTPLRDDCTSFVPTGSRKWKECLKGYFASITAMDKNIERIFRLLRDKELDDDTLVVFTSDNGFNCTHHGIWGKGNGTYPLNMYDNSIKVPAIFRHPGHIPAGVVTQTMVSGYDFFPTILAYAGITPCDDPRLPGRSFENILRGGNPEERTVLVDAVFDEYGPVRMIRDGRYKYIHRYASGLHELYDMEADPQEEHNLIHDKSKQERIIEMRQRIKAFFNRYGVLENDGAKEPVTGSGQHERVGSPGRSPWSERYKLACEYEKDNTEGMWC